MLLNNFGKYIFIVNKCKLVAQKSQFSFKKNLYIYTGDKLRGLSNMAIGAKDTIDKLLVQKYSDKQVDKHEITESAISADDVMRIMNYVSTNTMTQMKLSRRLSIACYAVNAMSANYNQRARLVG